MGTRNTHLGGCLVTDKRLSSVWALYLIIVWSVTQTCLLESLTKSQAARGSTRDECVTLLAGLGDNFVNSFDYSLKIMI